MFCPNCGSKINQKYCTHCGYMTNGNFIEPCKVKDDNILSYYFGYKYDYYVRNQNWFLTALLGPIYIISHNFYIIGILLFVLDLIITFFVLVINHMFLFSNVIRMVDIIYFFINRLVWASIGNMIYLGLLTKKLEKEKKSNPEHYKEILPDYYKVDFAFIKIKYVIFSILGIGIFFIIREILYSYLQIS